MELVRGVWQRDDCPYPQAISKSEEETYIMDGYIIFVMMLLLGLLMVVVCAAKLLRG